MLDRREIGVDVCRTSLSLFATNERLVCPLIDGELIVILLTSEGRFITQQLLRLTVADAIFVGLPPGSYTVIARHPALTPTEARQDIVLSDDVMVGIKYFYAEDERRLIKIEILERRLDA